MWEVFFYTKYDNWNLPDKWDIDNVAAVVEIETQKLKHINLWLCCFFAVFL